MRFQLSTCETGQTDLVLDNWAHVNVDASVGIYTRSLAYAGSRLVASVKIRCQSSFYVAVIYCSVAVYRRSG